MPTGIISASRRRRWRGIGLALILSVTGAAAGPTLMASVAIPPIDAFASRTDVLGDPMGTQRTAGLLEAGPGASCPEGMYVLRLAGAPAGCTHGPDVAPPSIDVSTAIDIGELQRRASAEARGEAANGVGAADTVPCIGTGTNGLRTVAVYAHAASSPSRYATVAPLIRQWIQDIDDVFDASAAKTGASSHVRWAHDGDCLPIVREVTISDVAAVGSSFAHPFEQMINELYYDHGMTRVDRRYLVWVDVPVSASGICGIAMNANDDSAWEINRHNGTAEAGLGFFARTDADCWGVPAPETLVEAHELMHTLGAVQSSAPHSSADAGGNWGHCTDEFETMCYADGSSKPLTFPCSGTHERLFDCRNDDYFNPHPPAGSYLATHWNTAGSRFLVDTDPFGGFLDISDSTFRSDIAWLAASGITKGCTAEHYCPDAFVTRGQLASFLVRALGLPSTGTDYFTDDQGSTHESDINRLAASGITKGCTPEHYCPDAFVTRGQLAAFLHRALD